MREKLKARSVRFKGRLNLTKKVFNYYIICRDLFLLLFPIFVFVKCI